MNNTETMNTISHATGIELEKCISIVDSLEVVLIHELEGTGEVRKFFDRIYLLLNFLKNEQDKNSEKEVADLVGKVALSSETSFEETQQVLDALAYILNNQLETSKSARNKFKTTYKLVNFFRHK